LEPEESPDECPGKEDALTLEVPSFKLEGIDESKLVPDEPEEESHAVHVVVFVGAAVGAAVGATVGAAVVAATVVVAAVVAATVVAAAVVAAAVVAAAVVAAAVMAAAVVAAAVVAAAGQPSAGGSGLPSGYPLKLSSGHARWPSSVFSLQQKSPPPQPPIVALMMG